VWEEEGILFRCEVGELGAWSVRGRDEGWRDVTVGIVMGLRLTVRGVGLSMQSTDNTRISAPDGSSSFFFSEIGSWHTSISPAETLLGIVRDS